MKPPLLERIVNAVLYEGYVLYPYRPAAPKNRRSRFSFGRVYPEAFSQAQGGAEPCLMQTECLVQCHDAAASLQPVIRFLQPTWREVCPTVPESPNHPPHADGKYPVVSEWVFAGKVYQTWQEAVEREIKLPPRPLQTDFRHVESHPFGFPAVRNVEEIHDKGGRVAGVIVRRREAVAGQVVLETSRVAADCCKITVRLINQTPVPAAALQDPEAALMYTLASAHTILHVQGGGFVSQTDPPSPLKPLVDGCDNIGTWPVLVGDKAKAERDTMLSSPVILYDYPEIAPERRGDFGDATEIDKVLALRELALANAGKREMGAGDAFARKVLERTSTLKPNQLLKMHGPIHETKAAAAGPNPGPPVTSALVQGVPIRAGDKVRIRPKHRADAFDLMLAGRTAVVEALEQDAENRIHLAVVLEDDPGRDPGLPCQPGHRFFYGLDEVEPLTKTSA